MRADFLLETQKYVGTVNHMLSRLIDTKTQKEECLKFPHQLQEDQLFKLNEKIVSLQLQLAPLMDRVGRYIADYSTFLLKDLGKLAEDN